MHEIKEHPLAIEPSRLTSNPPLDPKHLDLASFERLNNRILVALRGLVRET
jgi:hypothetical protein